jgi:hypothetical protein
MNTNSARLLCLLRAVCPRRFSLPLRQHLAGRYGARSFLPFAASLAAAPAEAPSPPASAGDAAKGRR